MAKLKSLEGATVTVPSGWTASAGYGQFSISNDIGSGSFNDTLYIGYYLKRVSGNFVTTPIDNYVLSGGVYSYNSGDLVIKFLDGTDVTRPELIQWLLDNGATIEGGLWEETNIQITTKESILLEMAGTKCEQDIEIIVEQEEVPVWDGTVEDYSKEMYFYVEDSNTHKLYPFVLPENNITLATLLSNYGVVDRNYYFYYSSDNNSHICSSKIQIDANITSTIWLNDHLSLVKETTDYVSNGEVIMAFLGGSN